MDARDVWYQVAQSQNGIELDIGDKDHTRIRVTHGKAQRHLRLNLANAKRRLLTYAEQKPKHGKPIATGDLCVGGNRDDADRSKVCGLVVYRISECAGLCVVFCKLK